LFGVASEEVSSLVSFTLIFSLGLALPFDRQRSILQVIAGTHSLFWPMAVIGVKLQFVAASMAKNALIFFPQFENALSVQPVQFARPPGQWLWHRLWKAPMGSDGVKLLVGETFKEAFVP
jgi:hypothetical protein